jgi:hypothetical protein
MVLFCLIAQHVITKVVLKVGNFEVHLFIELNENHQIIWMNLLAGIDEIKCFF